MFGLRNFDFTKESLREVPCDPVLIDGVEAYETLCPVSKLTGHRSNPLVLLQMVSDGNARLLDNILQVLPEVKEMNVPDDVKIDMLVPPEMGTFAERDAVINRLSSIADVLFDKGQISEVQKDVISFDKGDSATIDASPE